MHCPNCGLANPDTAKFCANCGTAFGAGTPPPAYQAQQPYQPRQAYPTSNAAGATSNPFTARNLGLGCLILVILFLFFGLSCTRACFSHRRARSYIHRRY